MESPLSQTWSKQTKDRMLRQRAGTQKRPKQHTPTQPWAKGAEGVLQAVLVGKVAVAVAATMFNASVVNALKPSKMRSEC